MNSLLIRALSRIMIFNWYQTFIAIDPKVFLGCTRGTRDPDASGETPSLLFGISLLSPDSDKSNPTYLD